MGGPEQETHNMDTSMFEPFNGKKNPNQNAPVGMENMGGYFGEAKSR